MRVIVLAASPSDDYQSIGSFYPKNLFEIREKPLIQYVIESLSSLRANKASFIFMISAKEDQVYHTGRVIKLLDQSADIVTVHNSTSGALCTALLAVDHIKHDEELVIINGDIIIDDNLSDIIQSFRESNSEAGVITFESVHPRWSYVKLDQDDLVIEAAEKKPISKNALTGFFWFSRGQNFLQAAESTIIKNSSLNDVFYISPVLNDLVLKQAKIRIYQIDKSRYHSLKQPSDALAWEQSLTAQQMK